MKKILVVEDDYDIGEIVAMALYTKYQVLVKQDSRQLIEVLKQFLPDVILIDNFIGQKNAEEIVNEIKSGGFKMTVPLILFSAHHDIEALALRIGAAGFLPKPFDLHELYQSIDSVLTRSVPQPLTNS